ncbi:MAG: isoleucine--tRNA ligase [Gammaproteobacteria bacterium]|nr:isoleucine--tRNA ligase [Gammaproteobacteria bacterium]
MSTDYRDTLNLPKTDLSMKAGLSKKEPELIEFWDSIDLYQKIRNQNKGKPQFILHDGPPYANGDIHLGHALNKILKDITIKFQSLLGMDAPYVPGWDCHGLPIELNVEKKHGKDSDLVRNKTLFIKACREYAQLQIENQKKDFIRLGVLGDWENPYLSLNKSFEADTIRALGRIIANGHLEKGEKPVHWCLDCKSALAEAEVEYKDKISHSIDVKFKVSPDSLKNVFSAFDIDPIEDISVVIWTTTPWTIPSNVAVCINKKFEYVLVKASCGNFIIAKDLLEDCSKRWNEELSVLASTPGSNLQNIYLIHPLYKRESKLLLADHVTTENGTGCVHTAPAHGLDDYFVCMKNKLETIKALNNKGLFKDEYGELSGLPTIKADPVIVELLKSNDSLLTNDEYEHSYPHCWRHKSPLIFMSTPQWFISMNKSGLIDGAINAVGQVQWEPSWGEERILSMLEDRPDWCISRQRNWGVPIPLIIHKETGDIHPKQNLLFNKIADVIESEGIEGWDNLDLKTFIDDSDSYRKVHDTLDVWFDSGVTHMCVLDKLYGADLIADLYLEGSDQHRGWFQSSLLTGIAINGMPPYKSVLTHGFVVDEKGRKQSKSLGNVISPQKIWDTLGADILRLWIASIDFRSEMVASDEIFKRIADQYRRIRNTFRFLLGNINDFDYQTDAIELNNLLELDKWVLLEFKKLQLDVIEHYKSYSYHLAVQRIHNFCVNQLGGLYLDIIKDRQYTTQQNSKLRRSAQTTIQLIVDQLVLLISPILSFTAEEIWQNNSFLSKQKESVFLSSFDEIPNIDCDLSSKNWQRLFEIKEVVNQQIEESRNSGKIKGSLDTSIEVVVNDDDFKLLNKVSTELHFFFITSECKLTKGSELSIKINKSNASKCSRCWHRHSSVGKSSRHPEICERCETNIIGAGEDRKFA